MRRMTYDEIVELSHSDLPGAIQEAKINMSLDRQNGDWAGLVMELQEREVD